jgi:branched-chain amino acid aminotransferase
MKICFNGGFYPANASLLTVQNRSFKWGDGLFETMKVFKGRLLLESLHFERLFSSLKLLQLEASEQFTQATLVQKILALCAENNCLYCARVRLAVYRDEADQTGFSIEALPLDESLNQWKTEGQTVCLYPYARKSMDAFANVKSANYLPYVLAQKFAAEKGMDDALLLNAANLFCDSSKANIFLIKNDSVYTPALHQGCVNGVMRRVVMEKVKTLGYRLHHDEVNEEDLLNADEVFLTNAIQIMRWVKQYKHVTYASIKTRQIFDAIAETVFA